MFATILRFSWSSVLTFAALIYVYGRFCMKRSLAAAASVLLRSTTAWSKFRDIILLVLFTGSIVIWGCYCRVWGIWFLFRSLDRSLSERMPIMLLPATLRGAILEPQRLAPSRLGSTEMLIACRLLLESFRLPMPLPSFPWFFAALMLITPFRGVFVFRLEAMTEYAWPLRESPQPVDVSLTPV